MKIAACISPLSRFAMRFQRAVAYGWKEFFWIHNMPSQTFALEDELNSELRWSQNRKGSMAHGLAPLLMEKDLPDSEFDWDDALKDGSYSVDPSTLKGPFYKALTRFELQNLLQYRWQWPQQAWQLNQDAICHGQHSNEHYMHTIIRNCSLIFTEVCEPGRWLTPSEMSLGFMSFQKFEF